MKKLILIVVLILLTGIGAVYGFADQKIYVKTVVSGDFRNEIRNSIVRGLQKSGDVVSRDTDPDFIISIVATHVKWDEGGTSTIVPISCVVKAADGSVGHWLVIGNSRDISEACSKIVNIIDTHISGKR
jgi:hypothetical protein